MAQQNRQNTIAIRKYFLIQEKIIALNESRTVDRFKNKVSRDKYEIVYNKLLNNYKRRLRKLEKILKYPHL